MSAEPPRLRRASTPEHTIVGLPTPPQGRVTPPRRRQLEGTELSGRYAVERLIGVGGMGTVYAGRHLTIDRLVAIKVLKEEYADSPDAVDRFLQEARAASRIRQENVIEITDFGTTPDGVVFFVMELLEGETLLRTVTQQGALPWPRVRRIMLQICAALQAAHDVGVIHRDLKPDNCLRITRGGDPDFVKVLDFGIAKVAMRPDEGRLARRTRVGIIVGTPEYMAPEHARGQPCDHRVDVYAAGAILYELSTGHLPYEADSAAEVLAMHLHAEIPDPRARVPDVPASVSEIVRRALAKDPDERWPTMAALADAIADVGDEPVEPRPTSPRPWWWLAAASLTATLGTAGWWATYGGAARLAPAAVLPAAPRPAPALAVAAPAPAPPPEAEPTDDPPPTRLDAPERASAMSMSMSPDADADAAPPGDAAVLDPVPTLDAPTARAEAPSRSTRPRAHRARRRTAARRRPRDADAETGAETPEAATSRPRTSFGPATADEPPPPPRASPGPRLSEVKNPFTDGDL